MFIKTIIKTVVVIFGVYISIAYVPAMAQTTQSQEQITQRKFGKIKDVETFDLKLVKPLPRVLSQSKPAALIPPKSSLARNIQELPKNKSKRLIHSHVNVEELKKIDPDSLGTLSIKQGGFGTNMWQDVSRSKVEKLLPQLPVDSKSRTIRDLMRRLLLSRAMAPKGKSIDPKKSDLIGARVELLIAMGDIPAATELINQVPSNAQNRRLLRNEVDSLFMRNDNARVCNLVASRIRDVDTPYLQKAHIFCQSLDGEIDKASLGASLLRETGDNDQVFHGLLNQLSGLGKFKVASLIDPDPLYFAMVRAANADLPDDVVTSNNPAILRTIATIPNARPELRLDAAERAEAMGALDTEILRQLYAGVPISEISIENSLASDDPKKSPIGRASLYRKALVEGVPTATAELLSKAFKYSREAGRYESMARVFLPILKNVSPSHDLVWFIPEAIRALLTAGDLESLAPWLSLLNSSAMLNDAASKIQKEIRPLAKLAGGIEDSDWQPEMLGEWRSTLDKTTEEKIENPRLSHDLATLVYCLLDGLGEQVPDTYWEGIMDGPLHNPVVMPQASNWRSLELAASNARVGETILLSLLAIGQTGPLEDNPIVLRKVLISLRKIGLEKEARNLALEAAIASGL